MCAEQKRKIRKECTKDNPFVPPLKDDEWWYHADAHVKYPEDLEIGVRFLTFHCPTCGIDFEIDTD